MEHNFPLEHILQNLVAARNCKPLLNSLSDGIRLLVWNFDKSKQQNICVCIYSCAGYELVLFLDHPSSKRGGAFSAQAEEQGYK